MMLPFRRMLVLTSFSSLLAVALALAVIAAFTVGYVERGQTLHIAVGPPGSAELRFIEALQPRLRQGLWQRRLEVLPTEGPLASAAAVDDGRADLAVVRSDIAIPKKAAIVFILHKEAVLLAARAGSKLDKVADLARDIVFTDIGNTVVDRKDLWDMPVNFMLIIGLLSAEWFLRKREGLA